METDRTADHACMNMNILCPPEFLGSRLIQRAGRAATREEKTSDSRNLTGRVEWDAKSMFWFKDMLKWGKNNFLSIVIKPKL